MRGANTSSRLSGRLDLRNTHAPADNELLAVCPHCWEVNICAFRLCGRCGADMHLALQESGGLRATAPVQSPVPMPGTRLTLVQRVLVLCFVAMLIAAQLIGAIYSSARRGSMPAPSPASTGLIPADAESSF